MLCSSQGANAWDSSPAGGSWQCCTCFCRDVQAYCSWAGCQLCGSCVLFHVQKQLVLIPSRSSSTGGYLLLSTRFLLLWRWKIKMPLISASLTVFPGWEVSGLLSVNCLVLFAFLLSRLSHYPAPHFAGSTFMCVSENQAEKGGLLHQKQCWGPKARSAPALPCREQALPGSGPSAHPPAWSLAKHLQNC